MYLKGAFVLILFLFCTKGYSQNFSSEEFETNLNEEFHKKYNINSLPDDFYQCAYDLYLESGNDRYNFDIGYRISRKCLLNYVDQIGFSDDGMKLLQEFKDAFVNGCATANQAYSEVIKIGPFCSCLHDEYLKYEIGYEMLADPEFMNTILSEKISTYCFTIHQKTQ